MAVVSSTNAGRRTKGFACSAQCSPPQRRGCDTSLPASSVIVLALVIEHRLPFLVVPRQRAIVDVVFA